jgi:F-type H+-transporting ATPase subunit a
MKIIRHILIASLFGVLPLCAAHAANEPAHTPHPTGAAEAAKHEEHKESAWDHVTDAHEVHLPGHLKLRLWTIGEFQLTKFMILELIAAGLIAAIYIPLARRARSGDPVRGPWDNAFETLLTFIRNEVALPNLGEHDADRHVPFLWTLFLFILFCNLLGMFPFMGSPTASIYVTGALALVTFLTINGAAIAKMGIKHYLEAQWPHLDIPVPVLGFVIKLLICVIEVFGNVLKCCVLAIRLFANMVAGHMVLATILFFVLMAANAGMFLWAGVTVGSVLGVVALSLLELFVAFLQAYIFTFLTALFMGMALHPQH